MDLKKKACQILRLTCNRFVIICPHQNILLYKTTNNSRPYHELCDINITCYIELLQYETNKKIVFFVLIEWYLPKTLKPILSFCLHRISDLTPICFALRCTLSLLWLTSNCKYYHSLLKYSCSPNKIIVFIIRKNEILELPDRFYRWN